MSIDVDTSDYLLTEAEHEKLSSLVRRVGEVRAAETLKISRVSMLRLLCKRPARLGTIALARIGLAKAGV